MSAPDTMTVLRTVDSAVLTKRIARGRDGGFDVQPYDRGFLFAVEQIPVDGILSAGQLIAQLQDEPQAAIIRGHPKPGIDRTRCRRLLYPQVENGELVPETFEPAASPMLGIDLDSLQTPQWNADDLARRRAAIERDRTEHPRRPPKGPDDGEDYDLAGDRDPAPIDPVKDWAIITRYAISTLPAEFRDAHCWVQLTSSAGLDPDNVRIRLWFWCDRPVSDAEAKRWLAKAPVDLSLYNGIQLHYIAKPLFDPPEVDPVARRSWFWWRHVAAVPVPELPEPPPPPPVEPVKRIVPTLTGDHREVARQCLERADLTAWEREFSIKIAGLVEITPKQAETLAGIADPMPTKAEAYAKAALRGVETATVGGRHPSLLAAGVRLYSLADKGWLDHADITRRLLEAGQKPLNPAEQRERCMRQGGRPSANEQALDWARARARTAPDLPEGFRS